MGDIEEVRVARIRAERAPSDECFRAGGRVIIDPLHVLADFGVEWRGDLANLMPEVIRGGVQRAEHGAIQDPAGAAIGQSKPSGGGASGEIYRRFPDLHGIPNVAVGSAIFNSSKGAGRRVLHTHSPALRGDPSKPNDRMKTLGMLAEAYANAIIAFDRRAADLGEDGVLLNLVPVSASIFAGRFGNRELADAVGERPHLDPSYIHLAIVLAIDHVRSLGYAIPAMRLHHFGAKAFAASRDFRDTLVELAPTAVHATDATSATETSSEGTSGIRTGSRVLFWNIRMGGTDKQLIADAIEDMNPDLVILAEVRQPNSRGDLPAVLRARGWRWQATHSRALPTYTLLAASRDPFESRWLEGPAIMDGRLLQIDLPMLPFSIFAAHVPENGRDKSHKAMWEAMFACADAHDRPVMIVGDLNTGAHALDEEGGCVCRGTKAAWPWPAWRDLFRESHGDVRRSSLLWHTGDGFRIDHAIGRSDLNALMHRIDYIDRVGGRPTWKGAELEGERALSDHAPLVMDIRYQAIDSLARHQEGWFESVFDFAMTFNAFDWHDDHLGDHQWINELMTLARRHTDEDSLREIGPVELRAMLFLECRSIRFGGYPPTAEEESVLRALEAEILRRHRRGPLL
ncbi:MAG: endonuclease/exonuclease/phosphatase family protein [Acidimicrobiia bacterium]